MLGSDGNLWFADNGTTKAIGRVVPSTGAITEYSTGLNAGAALSQPVVGPDGNMWFYDGGTTKGIGRITPAGVITMFTTGFNAGAYPYWLAAGSDGNIWFTDNGTTKAIGKLNPSTGVVTEYNAGTGGLSATYSPDYIWPAPDGSLWFDDGGATKAIGRVTTAGVISEYTAGLNPGTLPIFDAISPIGPDGNIWFDDRGTTHAVGRISIGGPVNTAVPTVTGTQTLGQTLTATAGTWQATPAASYSYQWQDCDSTGANCANIAGATASSYVVTAGDGGKTVGVVLTATNTLGSMAASVAFPPGTLTNTVLPSIGAVQQGVAAVAQNGSWTGFPSSYTYQWQACNSGGTSCSNITGATANTYIPSASNVGATLRVIVTAVNASGSLSATSNASAPAAGLISQFTAGLNAGSQQPLFITRGPDGNLWFADQDYAIGRMTPTGTVTEYTGVAGQPQDIVTGPDGNLWFTEGDAIGKINPATGVITNYTTGLAVGANTIEMTVGADGNLWFTDQGTTSAIGRITTAGVITEFSSGLNSGSFTEAIAVGPDGNVWFTDTSDAVGVITPSGTITEYSAGLNTGSIPSWGIVAGTDGRMWFTDRGATKAIGAINTSTHVIAEYHTGLIPSIPTTIAAGSDGALWFTDSNSLGRITTAGAITEYTSGLTVNPNTIAAGSDGNIWYANDSTTVPTIGRLALGGPVNTGLPTVSGSAVQGQALSVTAGGWSGTPVPAVGYQWQDCDQSGNNCANVAGATSSSYVLGAGDLGDTVRVIVTATNSLGYAPVALAQSAVVTGGPVNAALPVVSGAVQQGQAVSVSNGTWTGYPTPAYTYQWQDCNATGTGCSNITGATASSYTPAATDVAHTLIAIVTATNASGTVSTASAATGLVVGLISEFSSGLNAGGVPYAVTPGADGNVWFTDDSSATPAIGRITPTGVITEYSTGLNAGSKPLQGIVIGPDGNVWFTDNGTTPAIGKLNPSTGAITEYSSGLISGSSPRFITVGADGNLWFGDYGGAIGRITTAGVITEYTAGLNTGSHPQGITAGPDGNLWFTDNLAGAIGKITTAGVITEYSVTAGLRGITSGPDGNLWFTDSTGAIGRITTAGVVTKFSTGLNSGARPFYITPGADGNLWFQDSNPAGIGFGRITTTGVITEYTSGLPAGLNPYEITAGPDGNIWFADEGTTKAIGRIAIGGPVNTAQPTVSGTTQQGQTLTATTGTWTGYPAPTLTYQWQDCNTSGQNCTNITGATTNTYTLASGDVGNTVRVLASATNTFGAAAAPSAVTATVADPSAITVAPAISGVTQQGQALSATHGTWSNSPTGYTYQWQDCNSLGGSCVNVAGATGSGYNLGVTDVAQTVRVVVTASTSGGSVSAASAATGLVVGTISEFSTGLGSNATMSYVTKGADGNVWFTDRGSPTVVGRITPTGAITEFASGLNAGSLPFDLVEGPDGNVWFTDYGTTKAIGRITPAGVITEYSAGLNAGSHPLAITVGSDGNLWFTDDGTTPAIGKITTAGAITEYSTGLNAGSVPAYGIAAGSDGNLWFTDRGTTKAIGKITTGGVITEYSTGLNAGGAPNQIVPGPMATFGLPTPGRRAQSGGSRPPARSPSSAPG